jgi:tetratricopeptide (TPR) repeat protein
MISRARLPARSLLGLGSRRLLFCAGAFLLAARSLVAADLDLARSEFASGHYDHAIALAQTALKEREDAEEWGVLLTQSLLTKGGYPEALTVATNLLAAESRSVRLRWTAREALLFNGQSAAASRLTAEIQRLFSTRSWVYRDPKDWIVYGRVALLGGMDPKMVLEKLFEKVKKANPKLPEIYQASGDLALDKHDFALAAKLFQEGLAQLPDNADLHFGLARSYAPSDQRLMLSALSAALERNSNHVGSLLLMVDHSIDAEDYAGAEGLLGRVLTLNPWHPEAWAYRAVLAHFRDQRETEVEARNTALKFWTDNPGVDYLIGLKLSQKYRFTAGASHQKRALGMDANFLPAKNQLAQDLLRLGEEAEGWQLAAEVQSQDSYDVAANNLVALHDVLAKFQTLTNPHFRLRMSPPEAALYGARALDLLERARARLCDKYAMQFSEPVLVELFNDEKDFAVRTFGMPDNDGFLGVCFGRVITANSPASHPGRPFNWQAMLWHEFCHVVTLQLTRNKMPRWLSEGISVYEERQADPSWGERLTPRYRQMLLGEEFTPVSQLSRAFLAPKSGLHLQFAYYESSLVVEFLVERYGQKKLQAVLRELAGSAEINQALAKHIAPMNTLETQFEAFAQTTARNMAPGLGWEEPEKGPSGDGAAAVPGIPKRMSEESWGFWAEAHPTNYWVMSRRANRLISEKKWVEAKPLLQTLLNLYPEGTGSDSAYHQLAVVYRALGDTNAELAVLTRLAQKDDDAIDAYARLMELASNAGDWPTVMQTADRYLAVEPLVAPPYRFLALAAEASGKNQAAIAAYRALLLLDPADPAEVHFRLGKLLFQAGDPEGRRHVLDALEQAPRYREALRLLRQMDEEPPRPATPTTAAVERSL